jgi:hypothetical protein
MVLDYPAAGRCKKVTMRGRNRVCQLETELDSVERTIRAVADRTKSLADELGARYVVFRCSRIRYDDGRDFHNTDIIRLSHEADDCIEEIYMLEQRRKELLEKIERLIV